MYMQIPDIQMMTFWQNVLGQDGLNVLGQDGLNDLFHTLHIKKKKRKKKMSYQKSVSLPL